MGMGWKGNKPFLSPMCGSGTPAIEAAMIAMNKAPGSLKGHFAFQSIKGYNRIIPGEKAPTVAPRQTAGATPEQIWKEMVLEAKKEERRDNLPRIIATDISPEAVDNAQTNAITAGVAEFIEFHACDFAETPVPETPAPPSGETRGCVFFNPEYGIRLGDPEELKPIYARIGTFMNEKCRGWTGALITGNPNLAAQVNPDGVDEVGLLVDGHGRQVFVGAGRIAEHEGKVALILRAASRRVRPTSRRVRHLGVTSRRARPNPKRKLKSRRRSSSRLPPTR